MRNAPDNSPYHHSNIVFFPQKIWRCGKEVCPGLLTLGGASFMRWTGPTSVSLRGGARRQGLQHRGVGKRVGRSPSAAGLRRSGPVQLGMVIDERSRRPCLLDTGSQVSLWPPSSSSSVIAPSRLRLIAANGTPIKAYGQQRRQIKIDGKSYNFFFFNCESCEADIGTRFFTNV